jgi:guanylate kinase
MELIYFVFNKAECGLFYRGCNIHFVVTAMSKAMKPSEVDRKYYYFITKEEFLMMNEREELLEYALLCLWGVQGDPQQQVIYLGYIIIYLHGLANV